MSAPDDDTVDHAAVDAALDADDPTTYRLWRYRAVGMTTAQALVVADASRRTITFNIPAAEYAALTAVARGHGLTPIRYTRRSVATFLREEGYDSQTLPWLMRDGVWA